MGKINEGSLADSKRDKLKIYILAFSITKNFKTQKVPRSTTNPPPSNLSQIELIERFSMKAENLTSALDGGLKMFIKLIARENFERKKLSGNF